MWRNPISSNMQKRKLDALKVFLLVIGLPLGLVWACHALSQTLPSSHTVMVQVVLCDTQEQAESIPIAHRDEGYVAGTIQYLMLKQTLNGDGEPACSFGQWPMKVNKRLSVFAGLKFPPSETEKTMYILEVTIGETTYYAISQMDIDQGV